MRRREFLVGSAAALAWTGCGGSSGGPGGGGPPDGGAIGGADADPGAPDAGACAATEDNIEGPFYKEGAPSRMVLIEEDTPGTRLQLGGQVVAAGSCAPIAGATVDVWQADAEGAYDSAGFQLRGVLETGADGGYQVLTIVPGHYLNGDQYRPAHIHVKLSAPGYQPLTTQLYFEGDPYNDIDPFIRDSLIMQTVEQPDGSLSAEFQLALEPA